MSRTFTLSVALVVAAISMSTSIERVALADSQPGPMAPVATLKPADFGAVRTQALAWLATRNPSEAVTAQAQALWQRDPAAPADDVLDRLARTFALAEPRAQALVELCSHPRGVEKLPDVGWLTSDDVPPLVRFNMRLYYGRWLSQERLYDESLEQVAGLDPAAVADPATLLFHQAVVNQRLLHKKESLAALNRLLNEVSPVPKRYSALATLMQQDLKQLENPSLDYIGRQMDDVERRLDLGRAGGKVRKVEDDVIAALDKMIKDIESQEQQQQQAANGAAPRSTQAMPDSRPAGGKGPGDVQHRPIGKTAGWGDLPAKDREEALQQIGKDFPAHYRDAVEQYFRRLATERKQ